VVAGETALAGRALLCADALHLEASADGACPGWCERERERERKERPGAACGLWLGLRIVVCAGFLCGFVVCWRSGELV